MVAAIVSGNKSNGTILGSFEDFVSVGSDGIPDGIVRSPLLKCFLHQRVETPGDYWVGVNLPFWIYRLLSAPGVTH
jgi:hypothetical protein